MVRHRAFSLASPPDCRRHWHRRPLRGLGMRGWRDDCQKRRHGRILETAARNAISIEKPLGEEVRKTASRSVERSLTADLLIILETATGVAVGFFAFACWVSTLPAISPVSLSLAFRSWTAILQCMFHVWWISLCVFVFISLPVLLRPRDRKARNDRDTRVPDVEDRKLTGSSED